MKQISLVVLTLLLNCIAVSSQSGAANGFGVGIGNGPANANAMANADTESPTLAPTDAPTRPREIPERDLVLMTLSFGFEQGFEREPTQEEIEEVLCISDEFLREKLAEKVENSQLFAVNIEWNYDVDNGLDEEDLEWSEGKSYPIFMTFYLDATYADGFGTRIHKNDVFDALEMSREEVETFITEYVWSVSKNSVFYDCMRAHYNLSQFRPRGKRTVMLPEAPGCPVTRMPTVGPSVVPTISPAPTVLETLSPADAEDLVYFQLEVDLEESAEQVFEEPTREEIKALMCVVNSFIQDRLAEHTQDPDLATALTNIRWISSASSERTGLVLFFTTDTNFEGQDPVPTETVVQVLEGINQELLDFLHSEGALIYMEEDEINPLLELPTDVALQTMPPEFPVRTGAMDVYAEDCTAYDHSDEDGDSRLADVDFMGQPMDGDGDGDGNGDGNGNETSVDPNGSGSPEGADEVGGGSGIDEGAPDGSGQGNGNGNGAEGSREGGNQNGAGSVSIGEGVPTKVAIEVEFMVSNLDDIWGTDEVKHLGLARSWPEFTKEVVRKKSAVPGALRGRALQQSTPIAEYEPYSAQINKIEYVDCPEHTLEGLTCHNVQARYEVTARALDIRSQDEDIAEAKRFYQVATYQGIVDGTYNGILQNSQPGTPLYIGTIPEHGVENDDNSGMFPWWVILLLCLIILCCCCCLMAALWWRSRDQREQAKEEEVILEEKVVTNHRSWAPNDQEDDNTEIFLNDDVKDDDSEQDPAQCRALVPYTGDVAWEDDISKESALVPYSDDRTLDLCGSSFRDSMGHTRTNVDKKRRASKRPVKPTKATKGVVA